MRQERRVHLPVWQLVFLVILGAFLAYPVSVVAGLWYGETKGPFKNWFQVVDLEDDGDLDAIVSHTRWEKVDLSWAGVGLWFNKGDGTFELQRDRGTEPWPFSGFAAGAGDVDQDGDLDIFTQDFSIHLQVNQGGAQGGEPGRYLPRGGINPPPAYNQGYRDMGGKIVMGDLNGDGKVDAFVAGCCYGQNAGEPGYNFPREPSLSWVWINDSPVGSFPTGHTLPMDILDGRPIRDAALGDLDGDGDLDVLAAVGEPTRGTVDSQEDLVLLNDGTGQLAISPQPLGSTDSSSAALGDVNGDGRLDALVGTSVGADLWINQGNDPEGGGPNFSRAQQSFEPVRTLSIRLDGAFSAAAERLLGVYLPYGSLNTKSVFLSDMDGDGDLDALIGRILDAEVWWNRGQGEFLRSDVQFSYREDTGLAVADFDGDGDQDIFAGRNESDYKVWWNDGSGGFPAGRQ